MIYMVKNSASIFKDSINIDMSFPAQKPFNPQVSSTPVLGASSGNPKSFQDPKSVASVGSTIQSMSDQASADTLYDAPVAKKEAFQSKGFEPEAFRNEVYSPWILRTESCARDKKEGFSSVILSPTDYEPYKKNHAALFLVILGVGAILWSFSRKK
jgi:hypothetical protein